ncbi:hypothetical protein FRB99_003051 [Tulasnella sp. 403]|nr:hypothetical protein FRB99_003051 [Tulasnella sp. 403]
MPSAEQGDAIIRGLMAKGWTLQDIVTIFFYRGRILGCVNAACFTLLLWDWISNIPAEVQLIWTRKWSGGTYMYIFLRLFPLSMQAYEFKSVNASIGRTASAYLPKYSGGEDNFNHRVYALYGCSWRILVMNSTVFLGAAAMISYLLSRQLPHIIVFLVADPIKGCWGSVPSHAFEVFIPAAAYETYLWLLVGYKAYRHLSAYTKSNEALMRGEALLALLVRDSFVWFSAAVILMFGNIVAISLAKDGYNFLCLPVTQFATCAGGCRLILNLRGVYFASDQDTVIPSTSIGTFRAPPQSELDTTCIAGNSFTAATSDVELSCASSIMDEDEQMVKGVDALIKGAFTQDPSRDPEAIFGMHMAAIEKLREEAQQRRAGGDVQVVHETTPSTLPSP